MQFRGLCRPGMDREGEKCHETIRKDVPMRIDVLEREDGARVEESRVSRALAAEKAA